MEFNELYHYGTPGMKWHVRRYQNYDGTRTPEGKLRYRTTGRVFISGSSKTQDSESQYYRPQLSKELTSKIDKMISDKKAVLVGDAPGIDRQVQDYLNSKNYKNVMVYGPGKEAVRYSANSKWTTKLVDAPEHEAGSPEWLAAKDVAMTNDATEGLAVVLDSGAKATRNNVKRLLSSGKNAEVFQLDVSGIDKDTWVVGEEFVKQFLDK